MDLKLIVELAICPATPCFLFGSAALEAWTRRHCNPATGCCGVVAGSEWYLVRHRSLNPAQRPDFWSLNRWNYLQVVPMSFDVPAGVVDLRRREVVIDERQEAPHQLLAANQAEHQ